jgi:hypothetical protein
MAPTSKLIKPIILMVKIKVEYLELVVLSVIQIQNTNPAAIMYNANARPNNSIFLLSLDFLFLLFNFIFFIGVLRHIL